VKLIIGGKCCNNSEALKMVGMTNSLKLDNEQRKKIANDGNIILFGIKLITIRGVVSLLY